MFSDYAALIVLLPVLAFVLTLFFGKRLYSGGALLPIAAIAGSFIISIGIFFEIYPDKTIQQSWPWFANLNIGILIDPLAIVMLLMVSFVSLLIHIYAVGYMSHDPAKPRYFAETSLFTAALLGVVLSDNILQFFISWEIVGLCSFLLIGFWYHKPSAAAAAKKVFLVTRVGDVIFLVGILVIWNTFHTLVFDEIVAQMADSGSEGFAALLAAPQLLTIIPLLLFGGAIGKSAQFPLHAWLPDAMEGPATVSALIHAATMVKAGVYLTARSFIFLVPPAALPLEAPTVAILVIAVVGGFTAFFAGTMALTAYD